MGTLARKGDGLRRAGLWSPRAHSVIEFFHVSKAYGNHFVIRDLNLSIRERQFVFIVGPSGCGKTTLLRLLTRELEPDAGKITFDGKDISKYRVSQYRQQFGVVEQDFSRSLFAERTVYENVAFPLEILGQGGKRLRRRVGEILDMVGLASKQHKYPHELSGGERQRVAIARAIVHKPLVLLADEPTGNLDVETAWGIMRLLWEINQMGTTVLMVTHDVSIVRQSRGGRIVGISGGELRWERDLAAQPL